MELKEIRSSNQNIEAVVQRCSVKKVFLEISQNSKQNTSAIVPFIRPKACNFIKKEILAQMLFFFKRSSNKTEI